MTLHLRDARCIVKDQLAVDSWYSGVGRNNNVALWDGECFLTIGYKFKFPTVYQERHWDDDGPFQPFHKI